MSTSNQQSQINTNESLQTYYNSLESRIGYWLMLGGTRHFGYYKRDTYWPFPIHRSLRAMEDHLFNALGLPQGAQVLDAGCGVAHVAIHMGKKGLRVQGIDIVNYHLKQAEQNIKAQGLSEAISVCKMDYHHLDALCPSFFDGIYTMETFVNSTDPKAALQEFLRVLKPGGSIALFEYDHKAMSSVSQKLQNHMANVNKHSAMPSNAQFEEGVLERMLAEAGFEDIVLEDLSLNIRPMVRLFFILAIIPYLFVALLGLESRFINTVAAVQGYRGRDIWRYVAISARKPAHVVGMQTVTEKKTRTNSEVNA